MIPKTIHYIWFGGEKSPIAKQAILTWKKRAPEYNIIEWNETNLPDFDNQFYQDALAHNDYAFASDYARLKILEKYGGIYMDTDMYLLTNPSCILKNYDLVFGIQDDKVIISTSFIAARKNQEFIIKALKLYDSLEYTYRNNLPNSEILSPLLYDLYDFNHDTSDQLRGEVMAYNPNVLLQPSFNAVAMHIGEKSWENHSKHDVIRVKLRKHVKNQFSAGVFRVFNDIFRRII